MAPEAILVEVFQQSRKRLSKYLERILHRLLVCQILAVTFRETGSQSIARRLSRGRISGG